MPVRRARRAAQPEIAANANPRVLRPRPVRPERADQAAQQGYCGMFKTPRCATRRSAARGSTADASTIWKTWCASMSSATWQPANGMGAMRVAAPWPTTTCRPRCARISTTSTRRWTAAGARPALDDREIRDVVAFRAPSTTASGPSPLFARHRPPRGGASATLQVPPRRPAGPSSVRRPAKRRILVRLSFPRHRRRCCASPGPSAPGRVPDC